MVPAKERVLIVVFFPVSVPATKTENSFVARVGCAECHAVSSSESTVSILVHACVCRGKREACVINTPFCYLALSDLKLSCF